MNLALAWQSDLFEWRLSRFGKELFIFMYRYTLWVIRVTKLASRKSIWMDARYNLVPLFNHMNLTRNPHQNIIQPYDWNTLHKSAYVLVSISESWVGGENHGVPEWVECPHPVLEDRGIRRWCVRIQTSQFCNPGRVKPVIFNLILVAP